MATKPITLYPRKHQIVGGPSTASINSLISSSSPVPPSIIQYENIPCDISVYINAFVRMDSGIAVNAKADTFTNSRTIGVVYEKNSPILCSVIFWGLTPIIFSGLDITKEYFLSTTIDGAIQTTVPSGGGEIILRVGRALFPNRLVTMIGTPLQRAL